MAKFGFGSNFLRKDSATDKLSNLLDISPRDIKGKSSFRDMVANAAKHYQYRHENKDDPAQLANAGKSDDYMVIGYDINVTKMLEAKRIKPRAVEVGTKQNVTQFKNDFIRVHMPVLYTDNEGNIWQRQ